MSLLPVNYIHSHVLVHNNTTNQQENPPSNADAVQQNNGFLYTASLPVVLHEVGSKIVRYLDRKSLLTFASCSIGVQEDLKVAYFQSKSSFYYESILRYCPQLLSDPSVRLEAPQQPSTMGEMIDRMHYFFIHKIKNCVLTPNSNEEKLVCLAESVEKVSFENAKEILNTAFRVNFNKFELIHKFFIELQGRIPSDPDEAHQFLTDKVQESKLLLRTLCESPNDVLSEESCVISQMLAEGSVVLSPHVHFFIEEIVRRCDRCILHSLIESSNTLKEKYANIAFMYAVKQSRFPIAETLLSTEYKFSKEALSLLLGKAVAHNKKDVVRFLFSKYNTPSKLDINLIIPEAVKGGDVGLIRSLVSSLNELSQHALGVAVINATRVRNVEMLRLLLSFDISLPEADRQNALTDALLMRRNDEIARLLLVEGENLEQEFARISQTPRQNLYADPLSSVVILTKPAAGHS